MHEIGIAKQIIDIIISEMASQGVATDVTRVLFKVGKLNVVIPDLLQFNFDVLKKDYDTLHNTTLDVEEVPITVRCKSCNRGFELTAPPFLCTHCGGAVSVETGQEMWVESISVKEK